MASAANPPPAPTSDSLRVVIALSTHGSRAPAQGAATLCPANAANLNTYSVPFEQLTDKGMQQMVHAGAHTRDVYVESKHFLSPTLKKKTHFDAYFRADPSQSCGQSSVTFGYGLYPDSTSTTLGFPVPVPVVMQLLSNEHDIAVTHGPCRDTLDADVDNFDAHKGKDMLNAQASVLDQLSTACGRPFDVTTSPSKDLSVISDMMHADASQGLPSIFSPKLAIDVQTLALNQMLGRYLGSPRQVTYYLGGFPNLMLSQLNQAASLTETSPYKLYAYTAHRHLLHGMGFLLGWNFHFDGEPKADEYNTTALPAGTTLFIELHTANDGADPVVETHIWSPETIRTQVKLTKCSALACPLAEFNGIIDRHIQLTTTWQELCQYHPINQGSANGVGTAGDDLASSNYSLVLGAVLVALTLFAMHSAYTRINQFRRHSQYRPL
ncbi:hypothetical protein H310_12286 [Aphanomyces invadans]|uniref:Acid phosphatase n=1 Tax=Aphanomyces invadans TaxID=157072 RepID=A0A024TK29_9STRA|nr:hypothetical protein H310_12286 [Aphanomyces invadans]ETV93951.1 hypothetical protein H310_12286 [Aphanomyces invadans]|eukprot:XP_008877511.1 hypothetical protein H310_12286 [Aphanomyces invadans]